MAHQVRWHLWSGILGGLVAALVVSALPAVADTVGDLVGTRAVLSPGDPLQAGRVNEIDKTTWVRGSWPNSMLRVVNDGTGPALELNTQPGVAPLAVDSSRRVRQLNVDRVDNRHAAQLTRAAGAQSEDLPDQNGDQLTVSITAPLPGLLLVGGSIDSSGSGDSFVCSIRVDGITIPSTRRSVVVDGSGGATNNMEENCSTDGIVLAAGGVHVVSLNVAGRDSASFGAASLWVLWVGFDGQGKLPTEASIITLDAPTGDGPARHIQDG